jgi:ethanolamine transporter EutH
MEVILGVIGAAAIALGLFTGYEVVQGMQGIGFSPTNPLLMMQFAGPLSLVVSGILMFAFATALRFLREIRNSAARTAHYLREVAHPTEQ